MAKIRKNWVSREEIAGILAAGGIVVSTVAYTDVGGMTAGYIPFGAATGFLAEDANITWDDINKELNLGASLIMTGAAAKIKFSGTPGGGIEGISYTDAGGNYRIAFQFPGADVVALCNRAANGIVEIRANTAVAGVGGEVVAADFQDNLINLYVNTVAAGTLSAVGITDTGVTATNMAAGTTGERPGGIVGDIRYNSTLGEFELYIAAWHNLARGGANVNFGTIGCGTITIADGSSLLLQEDITFGGATTENQVLFPDNLADALSFMEGANPYLTFVTTNGSELITFHKMFSGLTAGLNGFVPVAGTGLGISGTVNRGLDVQITGIAGTNYGCLLTADGVTAGTNYGMYCSASNAATNNWAFYSVLGKCNFGTGGRIVFNNEQILFNTGTNANSQGYINYGGYLEANTQFRDLGIYNGKYGLILFTDGSSNSVGLGTSTFGANADLVLAILNGTAPTTSPADCFQMYSADIGGAAGKAGAHFRDEEGNVVSIGSGGMLSTGTARTLNALWVDAGGIKAPGAKPATEIAHGVLETPAWQFADAILANQETISFNMRIPNRMDRTVAPSITIGWSADGANPGDCEWQLEYLWTSPGEDTGAAAQETLPVTGTAAAVADGLVLTTFAGIDLPSATDVCIHCRITRLSADANDTIADTVELHGVCLNWTSNKLGLPT